MTVLSDAEIGINLGRMLHHSQRRLRLSFSLLYYSLTVSRYPVPLHPHLTPSRVNEYRISTVSQLTGLLIDRIRVKTKFTGGL